MPRMPFNSRKLFSLAIDLTLATGSMYIAFLIRFDGVIPQDMQVLFYQQLLPNVICIRGIVFIYSDFYAGPWKYFDIKDLIEIAQAEFGDLIGAKGEPLVARVRHWPRGLPQYRLGHNGRVATMLEAYQRVPGLYMTGNYICGPSVSVCVEQAGKTAAGVANYLSDAVVPEFQGGQKAAL